MNKTLLHYARLTSWAFAAVLVSSSAFGAEAVAPWLALDPQYGYPRLAWPNVPGHAYSIQTRERLAEGDWSPLVTLTADANAATWTDELEPGATCFYRVGAVAGSNWASKLQTTLDSVRKSHGAKGASAVVITTNGIWQGTSGLSDLKTTNSIQPQMRFGIASNSKMFTAALVLQLAEEGKLTLEDTLGRWLPDYPNITNTITIRQLLNHTSGVFDWWENTRIVRDTSTDAYRNFLGNRFKHYTPQETLAYVKAPYFAPGRGWHYSNTGYLLLGLIAEAVTGHPIASELRTRFLEPLDLRSTYLADFEPATGELAHGFSDVDGIGAPDDISALPMTAIHSLFWTAGAMNSTAVDLAHWARALYGGTVLQAQSLTQMTQWAPNSGSPYPWAGYGLGTMRWTTSKGDFWGHGGLMPGYASCSGHSPTRNITVVLLVNPDGPDPLSMWKALVNAL